MLKGKWDFSRIYNTEEAMNMLNNMKDGAWKGRIDDDIDSLKRVIEGKGKESDFEILESYGLYPEEEPWKE